MDATTPSEGEAAPSNGDRPEDPTSALADQTLKPDTAPATYWTVGTPAQAWGRPSQLARLADLGLVMLALAAFYVLSVVAVAGRALPAPERLGYQIGTISVGLAVGIGARWFYLRGRPSVRPLARLFSPWLLLGLGVLLFAVGGSLGLVEPKDPATALRIEPEYVLVELDPAEVAEMEREYTQITALGRGGMAVREVDGADGSVSFLIVVDGGFAPDGDLNEVARGIVSTAGGERELDSISGTPVAVVVTTDLAYVAWIEAPFLVVTLGADELTAREVAMAVLSVPR